MMIKWVFWIAMALILNANTLAMAQVAIEVTELGKTPVNAILSGFAPGTLRISDNGQAREIALKNLLTVKAKSNRKPASGSLFVQLRDGSRFRAVSLTGSSDKLVCETSIGKLELDTKKIATCEFRKLNATQLEQWKTLIDSQVKADILVVVRAEDSLDKVEGLISKIQADSITFDFDGQSVDAPVGKLAGIKFFAPNAASFGKSAGILRDARQNTWMISSIQSTENDRSLVTLQCGTKFELSNSELQEIDFSAGSFVYLASLDPIERTSKPRADVGIALPSLAEVFGPRVVSGSDVSDRVTSNIEFIGAGTISYRVPEGFDKLTGVVEMAPEGQKFHRCRAAVTLEGKVLWEHTFDAPHKPQAFEVKVASDQRVKLIVESMAEPPVGDTVMWSQLRLTK